MRSLCGTIVLLAVLGSGEARAANAELQKAERQFEAFKYAEADKSLVKALAVPKNDRATILRIYELRGIIDATVGKKGALEHFRKLVALDPDRVLSRDYGPRILSPFYEAKARLDESPPIRLEMVATLSEGSQRLAVKVQHDTLKLGAKVRLAWRLPEGAWSERVEPVKPEGTQQVVASDTVEWYAVLLSANDGQLLEAGSPAEPLKAAPPPPAPLPVAALVAAPTAPAPKPLSSARKVAIATGAVGVGALGGALAAGIISRSARTEVESPQRDEAGRLIGMTPERARELEQRTVSSAIAANVLLGCGAGLVALGVVLFIADPGSGAQVAVAPAPGGLSVAGTFP